MEKMVASARLFREAADHKSRDLMFRSHGHVDPYQPGEGVLRDGYMDAVADFAEAAVELLRDKR